MTKYLIQQTIDINVQYIYETEDDDPISAFRDNDGYATATIISIEPLSWDIPWDSEEAAGTCESLSASSIKDIFLGVAQEFLTNKNVK